MSATAHASTTKLAATASATMIGAMERGGRGGIGVMIGAIAIVGG